MVTVHDCDGKLVAYSLSTFAYSVKSHPRNIKRTLQASLDDSEDAGNSRTKRRRANSVLAATSTTSIAENHAAPEISSASASSNQQQFGGSANTGGPPMVEPAADQSRGAPIPMVDPSLLQDLFSLNTAEGPQPMPTLDEAVPASCSWRGGIVISLFVNNLPQDGPIYARFGGTVVKTVGVQLSIYFNEARLSLELRIGRPPMCWLAGSRRRQAHAKLTSRYPKAVDLLMHRMAGAFVNSPTRKMICESLWLYHCTEKNTLIKPVLG